MDMLPPAADMDMLFLAMDLFLLELTMVDMLLLAMGVWICFFSAIIWISIYQNFLWWICFSYHGNLYASSRYGYGCTSTITPYGGYAPPSYKIWICLYQNFLWWICFSQLWIQICSDQDLLWGTHIPTGTEMCLGEGVDHSNLFKKFNSIRFSWVFSSCFEHFFLPYGNKCFIAPSYYLCIIYDRLQACWGGGDIQWDIKSLTFGYIVPSRNNMWCPWWASNICTTGSTPILWIGCAVNVLYKCNPSSLSL